MGCGDGSVNVVLVCRPGGASCKGELQRFLVEEVGGW